LEGELLGDRTVLDRCHEERAEIALAFIDIGPVVTTLFFAVGGFLYLRGVQGNRDRGIRWPGRACAEGRHEKQK
jgi:hypothetical protein